jgi:hypothetical protein
MANPRIAGIFETPVAAERAKERLLENGVLTVVARSQVEKENIAALMRRSGARDTLTPP